MWIVTAQSMGELHCELVDAFSARQAIELTSLNETQIVSVLSVPTMEGAPPVEEQHPA